MPSSSSVKSPRTKPRPKSLARSVFLVSIEDSTRRSRRKFPSALGRSFRVFSAVVAARTTTSPAVVRFSSFFFLLETRKSKENVVVGFACPRLCLPLLACF